MVKSNHCVHALLAFFSSFARSVQFLSVITIAIFFVSCVDVPKEELDAPENLRAENVTDFTALICWDKVDHADSYLVDVDCISNKTSVIYTWTEETKFLLENLIWEETYEVKVSASTSAKGAFWNKYEDGKPTTFTFSTTPRKFPEVPAGEIGYVTKINAVQNQDKSFTFNWEKIEGADFYDIICEHFMPGAINDVAEYKFITLNASEQSYFDTEVGEAYKVRYSICGRDATFSNECRWNETKKIVVQ